VRISQDVAEGTSAREFGGPVKGRTLESALSLVIISIFQDEQWYYQVKANAQVENRMPKHALPLAISTAQPYVSRV
jgi:hypothetical protein